MYIIGELINGMYRNVREALAVRNAAVIKALARRQVDAGADALDINCGPLSKDPVQDMRWLVETIQSEVAVPLCLDNTKQAVIAEGLKACRGKAIINSTTADPEKLDAYLGLAQQYHASLIALTVDKNGVPQDTDRRLELAALILEHAGKAGFSMSDLYLDPVLMPINIAQNQLYGILHVIQDFALLATPAPKTVVGLSNVSQGSKNRSAINRTFLVMAQVLGLKAAILDPLDEELMRALVTGELVLNQAIYCDSYLDAYLKSKKQSA
ncbi:MAG: dihydropteroate synthase [Candidatus Omnitrophica bacterium]|nr:dihydropteroate synthase [Candidatus Omnitrophota bacterium]MDD5573966.1 dihydropteroate synthase [Candidatus Omnitrophota bacterium]